MPRSSASSESLDRDLARWSSMYREAVQLSLRPWQAWFDAWREQMDAFSTPGPGRCARCGGRGCGACAERCDPCECRVCDADLVVYGRPGERRVVPLHIDNDRHQERTVELGIDGWATEDGQAVAIEAQLTRGSFVMEPCSSQLTGLVIEIGSVTGGSISDHLPHRDVEAEALAARRSKVRHPRGCVVAYGRLSGRGCLTRPVVVAVAILSNDCHPHEIACGCCDC